MSLLHHFPYVRRIKFRQLCLQVSALLALSILMCAQASASPKKLFIYCCAGFRPPLEETASQFEALHDVKVEMTFAGSGCLIAQAELAGRGDIFLPGESHYITRAQERGIVGEATEIAYLRPVIAVRKGNPHKIDQLADLAKPGLRIGLGDARSVAVGVATESWFLDVLGENVAGQVSESAITRAINVNELGNQLALGAIDAAIVWDVTVPLFQDLEAVEPASALRHRTVITGGVLKLSKDEELSQQFLRFLTGPVGQEILKSYGYEPFTETEAVGEDLLSLGAEMIEKIQGEPVQ